MKQTFIIIISLLSNISYAQIYSNGNLTTQTIALDGLIDIDIQLNADITLDYRAEETMTITADGNVMNFIGQKFKNGKGTLNQITWIEPSKNPKITIGSPKLKKVYQGTHSTTYIINLNNKNIWVDGNVSEIYVSGSCSEVRVNVSGTDVDLSKTVIDYADITIVGSATAILNKVNKLDTDLDRKANLVLLTKPNQYLGNRKEEIKT